MAWLHLAVLWAFAFAKPLFDVLADSPEFFVARSNTRGDILLFTIGLVLVPPSAMVAIEAAAATLPTLRRAFHLTFVAGLAGAIALQVLDELLEAPAALLLVAAAGLGLLAAAAYARTRVAPAVLTVLSPAPLIFVLIFLLGSPVSKLLFPEDAGESDRALRSDAPVVMLVFDEFDPNMLMTARDRIDRTRYPHLSELAGDATWYPNATTVNSQTTMAVPALLSGRQPQRDSLPVPGDYPDTLFTLLDDSHAMHVTETATELCAESVCGGREREPTARRIRMLGKDLGIVSLHLLLPAGLRSGLPTVDRTFGDFAAGGRDDTAETGPGGEVAVPAEALQNRKRTFEAMLNGITPQQRRPGFHFLHVALPHMPWQYLPTGQQYVSSGPDAPGLVEERWAADPFPPRLGLQRHLLQVGYVDHLIGRLTARLRDAGLYDRALIVITADHGVSYRSGLPRRAPEPGNFSDIAGVPLLVKRPEQRRGRVNKAMVRTVDVAPTVAQALGTRLPWKADGSPASEVPSDGVIAVGSGNNGRVVRVPFADYLRRREAGLRRMIRLFGSGDGGAGLYATGPDADLVGRSARPLAATGAPKFRVELDSMDVLNPLQPRAEVVPSFVTGRLEGYIPPGSSVAVAINGRVWSTTQTFVDGQDQRVAAMVPPEVFRSRLNQVELFVVSGSGPARRLIALQTDRAGQLQLVERDGETLIAAGGSEFPVAEGRLEGFVDAFENDDEGLLRLGGWAVDREALQPAERVLAFAGTRLIAQGRPTLPRPDIVDSLDTEDVSQSGFELRAGAAGVDPADVRVFALSADAASELPRYEK